MNTFLRNTISKLYNAVSASVAATRDAIAERLPSVRDTTSLLYNRMMENMGYGEQEQLKDIVKKKQKRKSSSKNRQRPRKKRSNSKNQQQPKNNRMMMMSDMIRLQK